jgi:hypothetical protein
MRTSSLLFPKFIVVAAAMATFVAVIPAYAQNPSPNEVFVQLTPADHSAAQTAKMGVSHAYPANNAAGQALRARQMAERRPANNESSAGRVGKPISLYPGDVTSGGGKVVTSMVAHAVYLQKQPGGNCTIATCWGDPEGFLRDLGNSDFVHVVDQYIGEFGGNRYTIGSHAWVYYTPPAGPITDLAAIVHAVAAKTGATGYGHIYHVFLPPGQDECADQAAGLCYSPDNPVTFTYCGYHNSVNFQDIGYVMYTVQPFEDVPGCQVQPGTVNGTLVDSADNVLGHETFETITDPDLDAWRVGFGPYTSVYLGGVEIADLCQFNKVVDGQNYHEVPTFLIGAHRYAVQLIYSNEQHACSSAPSRGNP